MASYFPFNIVECSIGIGVYISELCKRTDFKLLLELSINNLHSSGLYSMTLNLRRRPGISIQKTKSGNSSKNLTNLSSLVL